MSFKDDGHSVSNISQLQGSRDLSTKEMGPEGTKEVESPLSRKLFEQGALAT